MTTHVFIVNEQSFKIHLEYLFVGTGSKNNDVDFNAKCTSQLHPQTPPLAGRHRSDWRSSTKPAQSSPIRAAQRTFQNSQQDTRSKDCH